MLSEVKGIVSQDCMPHFLSKDYTWAHMNRVKWFSELFRFANIFDYEVQNLFFPHSQGLRGQEILASDTLPISHFQNIYIEEVNTHNYCFV